VKKRAQCPLVQLQFQSLAKLIENSYDDLMNHIANVGPMSISVDASNWSSYSSGIFNGCNQVNPDIDHAV
jgi:cathepsin L